LGGHGARDRRVRRRRRDRVRAGPYALRSHEAHRARAVVHPGWGRRGRRGGARGARVSGPPAGPGAAVTGGSRGIGRAIALRLAREGATVAVGYATQAAAADETVAAVEAAGGKAFAVGFDVGRSDAVAEGMDVAVEKLGRLDVLVNNAGVAVDGL